MSTVQSRLLICSCEKTMPLDAQAIRRGCAANMTQANQLCGVDLDQFKAALAEGAPITVACTQEAPLFRKSPKISRKFPSPSSTFAKPAAGRTMPPRQAQKPRH